MYRVFLRIIHAYFYMYQTGILFFRKIIGICSLRGKRRRVSTKSKAIHRLLQSLGVQKVSKNCIARISSNFFSQIIISKSILHHLNCINFVGCISCREYKIPAKEIQMFSEIILQRRFLY